MPCPHTPTPRRRIPEVAPARLIEKFSRSPDSGDEDGRDGAEKRTGSPDDGDETERPRVERSEETVTIAANGDAVTVPVDAVEDLRDRLGDALTERTAYLHTVGEHRADGTYVVERRGADSAGNSKVFDSFRTLSRLAERLPEEVVAEDLSRAGLTGGRRHMVLWHLVESPAFAYELERRQPLTARWRGNE